MKIYLEGNQINDGIGYKPPLPFRISVHDPMSAADITGYSVEVKAGYISTFLITPSQIVTSGDTKHIPIEKRLCRFKDENDKMILFKDYTKANCNFECKLKVAFKRCQCIPWDYPQLNSSMATCDRFGRNCFKAAMIHSDTIKKCRFCKNDCVSTSYSYSVYSSIMDVNTMCSDKNFRKALQYGYGYESKGIMMNSKTHRTTVSQGVGDHFIANTCFF